MGLGGLMLGSPIFYLKGMRIMMFQLSGYYYMVRALLLMDKILHDPKDPKLWELCIFSYNG